MERIEVNVLTGEKKVIPLSASEIAAINSIENQRVPLLQQVATQRDRVLSSGMAYTFGMVLDGVQTRPQDQVNLIVLRDNARDALVAGVTAPVLEFRALSDTSYWLTPQQVLDMTGAVRTFGYNVYKASWGLKGQIEAASTLAELQAIDITTGWPN